MLKLYPNFEFLNRIPGIFETIINNVGRHASDPSIFCSDVPSMELRWKVIHDEFYDEVFTLNFYTQYMNVNTDSKRLNISDDLELNYSDESVKIIVNALIDFFD